MDVDENHSEADQRPHHPLKSAQSPQPSALKTHLTNGNVVDGMEAEDSDHSNNEIVVPKSPSAPSAAPSLRVHEPPPSLDCSSGALNENGNLEAPPSLEASELSPTLRRSTRAACLKAQEKLKLKDGMVDSHALENGPTTTVASNVPDLSVQTTAANAEVMETPQKKKRKLSTGVELDQDDCKFGIRLDDDGDVVMMTDESDISSLNDEEAAIIRQKFEETKSKLNELTPEAKREREFQVRELEAAVRLEEAKLAMLKKTRTNQQLTARNAVQDAARRLTTGTQNSTGAAYKPPVAQQTNARVNGTPNAAAVAAAAKANQRGRGAKTNTTPAGPLQMTPQQQQLLQRLVESGSLRPEQILAIIQAMNPSALSGLSQNAARQHAQQREQQQQREAQERERRQQAEREAAARKAAEAQAAAERLARENAQNAQQKIAAARVQFRRIAEQRMLTALPPPKAPVSDLSFVPNAAQPDFLYLLGLDLVVQRNLKDKNVFKKVEFEPYVCEECGTDFTPNWKAIAGEKGDLHLYCEQCLRQAQKRRVRHDRNVLLKKLFTKISDEEKEFERQIQSGKLAESLGAVNSSNSTKTEFKAESKVDSTPPISKTSGLSANFNAAALSNLVNNIKNLPHSASSLLNPTTTSGSGSSSANRNAAAAATLAAASRSATKQETKKPAATTPSRGAKRGHNGSSSSNSSAINSQLAALATNPQAMNNLMSQLQTLQAMRNMNPAVFGNVNPQAILQLYQQRMNAASTNAGNNANVMSQLMNQLSTIAQNQNHNTSTTTSASSNHQQSSHHGGSGSGSTNSAANLLQQMNQMGVNSANFFRQLANARGGSDNAAAQNFLQQMAAAAARKK